MMNGCNISHYANVVLPSVTNPGTAKQKWVINETLARLIETITPSKNNKIFVSHSVQIWRADNGQSNSN